MLDDDRLRWTLGLGATAGIAAMALVLIPAVRARRRALPARRCSSATRPCAGCCALSGWTLGYVVANQVTIVVVRNLADPGSGDASAYFDAFTFFVLPHGLLAVSIATTFAPEMARSVDPPRPACVLRPGVARHPAGRPADAARRRAALRAAPGRSSARCCSTASTPPADADNASRALGGFALGLVGFSVYLFVLRGFYAHQDTRTPFVINVGAERAQHRAGVRARRPLRHPRPRPPPSPSPTSCAALWALQVLAYKVPGFPLRAVLGQPVADGRRRRPSPAR